MFYFYCCQQNGDEREPCYPSVCEEVPCDHRARMLEQYSKAKKLVLACHISWCEQLCSMPCDNMGGVLCSEEIERLRDLGLTVAGVLRADLKKKSKIRNLDEYRLKRLDPVEYI